MKLPRKLLVMGREYKIIVSDSAHPEDDEQDPVTKAETDSTNGTITLYPVLLKHSAEYITQIFIHELSHAIFYELGLDEVFNTINYQMEEVVVSAISNGLVQHIELLTKLKNAKRIH